MAEEKEVVKGEELNLLLKDAYQRGLNDGKGIAIREISDAVGKAVWRLTANQ